MNESLQERMAKIEERVKHLDEKIEKGFEDVSDKLKVISVQVVEIGKGYLTKDEYYKDASRVKQALEDEYARRAPWRNIFYSLIEKVLQLVLSGLILFILINGQQIAKGLF